MRRYPPITAIRPMITRVSFGPVFVLTVVMVKSSICMVCVHALPCSTLSEVSGMTLTRYVPACDGVNVNDSALALAFPMVLNAFSLLPLASMRRFHSPCAVHVTVTLSFFCSHEMFAAHISGAALWVVSVVVMPSMSTKRSACLKVISCDGVHSVPLFFGNIVA